MIYTVAMIYILYVWYFIIVHILLDSRNNLVCHQHQWEIHSCIINYYYLLVIDMSKLFVFYVVSFTFPVILSRVAATNFSDKLKLVFSMLDSWLTTSITVSSECNKCVKWVQQTGLLCAPVALTHYLWFSFKFLSTTVVWVRKRLLQNKYSTTNWVVKSSRTFDIFPCTSTTQTTTFPSWSFCFCYNRIAKHQTEWKTECRRTDRQVISEL